MTMSDPLSDMLARIRNGQKAGKVSISCPYSKLRENVCKVLEEEGFIRGSKIVEVGTNKKDLVVDLKYAEGEGAIKQINRVSKPGRRNYTSVKDMPRFYNGLGILIVSTPKGVMPDYKARAANVGGEVLCQVF